ncbi:MAG: PIG-L family deacetylase [Thermoplasmata archaeon]|nr:MAG: PIG-L family deacetylase [Thermoplasmata archaeon]
MVDFMGKSDILIFAPHPDDEALGCAGLIYSSIKKNKKVKVVVVANGESSVDGTERYYGHKPETQDFINIGYVRQKESVSAMKVLGLSSEDVIFLGYPNDGLMEMLSSDKYDKESPYKSEFTHFDRVSYENSYSMGAPFCKESFYSDIKSIFNECRPREVYVTHPLDSHFDHQACGRYISSYVKQLDNSIRVLCYVISPSKIPSPKQSLVYKLAGQMTERHLDKTAKEMKKRFMDEYKSQSYLFDQVAFHFNVERYWKLKRGVRAKIAKKIFPNLRFL